MLRSHIFTASAGFLAIIMILLISTPEENAEKQNHTQFPISELTIVSANDNTSRVTYKIEIASNIMQRMIGLQNRSTLPAKQGMLFLFGIEKRIAMWMKNTYIPLDMLFISEVGAIVAIVKNTIPGSEQAITPRQPAYAVLEVNAGDAELYDIKVGDRVLHEVFHKN